MTETKLSARQIAALKRKEKLLKNSDNRLDRITGVQKGKSQDEINEEAKAKEVEVAEEDIIQAQKQKKEAQVKPVKASKEDLLKKAQALQNQLKQEQLAHFKKFGYGGFILLLSVLIFYFYSAADIPEAVMTVDQLFPKLQMESIMWEEITGTFPILGIIPDFFSVFVLFELVYQGIIFLSFNPSDNMALAFSTHFATSILSHISVLITFFGLLSIVYQ